MALTGIQIFKHLPKTNCKECNFPTCLAFAMRLAAAQAKLSDCPHVSDEAKQFLGAASAPPIRLVKLGQGDEAVEIGDETVLFRHEKKFNHPTILAANIEDTSSSEEIDKKLQAVEDSEIERVGQKLKVEMVCLTSSSNDPQKYQQMVKQVAGKTKRPLILAAKDTKTIEAGLEIVADRKPLLHAATDQNIDAMASLAKSTGCPLAVKAEGLESLAALSEKAASLGIENLVLDPGNSGAGGQLSNMTQIRRSAIKQKFKALGYPTMAFPGEGIDDADFAAARAGVGILK